MERIVAGDILNKEDLSQNKDIIEKKIVITIIRDPELVPERNRSSNDKSDKSPIVKVKNEDGYYFPKRL